MRHYLLHILQIHHVHRTCIGIHQIRQEYQPTTLCRQLLPVYQEDRRFLYGQWQLQCRTTQKHLLRPIPLILRQPQGCHLYPTRLQKVPRNRRQHHRTDTNIRRTRRRIRKNRRLQKRARKLPKNAQLPDVARQRQHDERNSRI